MVQEFDVIVNTFSVSIVRATSNLRHYHFAAIVDGEPYHYRVIKGEKMGSRVADTVFGRASVAVHYHAKNQGNYVRFEAVHNQSKKPKEVSKKQRSLF